MNFSRALTAYLTLTWCEVRRTLRIWAQSILPAAITTTLYFVIFGHLMGERIGHMSGLPYLEFIVPGLLMLTMLNSAFNASASLFYMYKWTHVLEEMLVSPMSSMNILNSFMSVGMVRALIVGLVVGIISTFFIHLRIEHVVYMLFITVLASGTFSLFGVLNGLFAKNWDQVSIIPTFVITPLTYLGGVFYSINILPEFWQHVALFNPIVYIISTFRYAFFGQVETNVLMSTLIMLAVFLIFYAVCYYLIHTRKGISD
jgi:ABC-2 type transport system permease protein